MGIWIDVIADVEGIADDLSQKYSGTGQPIESVSEFPWPFVIVVGVALLAIIITIIKGVKAKKAQDITKKKTLYEQGYLQYRSSKEPVCSTYLNCDSGYLAGRRYPITNRLTIGHNPERCNVLYSSRVGGIASEHCEVRLRSDGQVEIVDLGSIGGTFLENGRQLMPNVPTIIKNGGRFYLATTGEMFRIDDKIQ